MATKFTDKTTRKKAVGQGGILERELGLNLGATV